MTLATLTQTAAALHGHIHQALFGQPGPVGRAGCSLDDVHRLSQDFALMAPLGGGGMLAFQALGHQTCPQRRDRRQ